MLLAVKVRVALTATFDVADEESVIDVPLTLPTNEPEGTAGPYMGIPT